jgi:hypothetical protein
MILRVHETFINLLKITKSITRCLQLTSGKIDNNEYKTITNSWSLYPHSSLSE